MERTAREVENSAVFGQECVELVELIIPWQASLAQSRLYRRIERSILGEIINSQGDLFCIAPDGAEIVLQGVT